MYRLLLFILILINSQKLIGQSFFDILPDVGGIGGQAMCFILLPDSNSIHIIGHRYDTISPGPNTKPWIGSFSYDGDLISISPLVDSNYNKPFNVINSPLAHKVDDLYYYYARRDIGGIYLNPYLIELNLKSGQIQRAKMIINGEFPDLANVTKNITFTDENIIILTNSLHKPDSVITYLTLLDTTFNIQKVIEVKEVDKINHANYTKLNIDNTFTILGIVLIEKEGQPSHYEFYLNIVDSFGIVLDHKLAPTTIPLEFGISDTYTIIEDEFGNWIIGGIYKDDRSDSCVNCYQSIPYIFSTTSDFSSLLWQTRFYDIPNQNAPKYFLHAIAKVDDGFIVAGDFLSDIGSNYPKSGVLFKTALNGDSLWMKHYIPLNWEDTRVAYVNFNDIKTAPDGNIVVGGAIGDLDLQIVRPWILYLNKDGCLVPGCNTVGIEDQNVSLLKQDFYKLYPNPAAGELYLLSSITSSDPVNIRVVSTDGKVLKMKDFNPVKGSQYIFSTEGLNSGMYQLLLTNAKTNQQESHAFFVK